MLLLAERNAAIGALLDDPDHMRTFETNAAAEQQRLTSIHPSWAT
jgi:hypothetical protein